MDRQTHDRVEHPTLGPGTAIYDNGPAAFVPDATGSAIALRSVDLGGCSMTRGSWLVFRDVAGARTEVKQLSRGSRHSRMHSPMMGDGWLVDLGGEAWTMRFDADDGRSFSFAMREVCVGRPAYREKMNRSHTRMPKHDEEEMNWRTYVAATGEVFAFRKTFAEVPLPEPAPAKTKPRKRATPKQGTLL